MELDEAIEGSRLQRFVNVQGSTVCVIWHGGATFNVLDPVNGTEVDVFTSYADHGGGYYETLDGAAAAIDRWAAAQDETKMESREV